MNIISLIKKWDRSLWREPEVVIRVNLRDIKQLFNSMDPSPFNEKDLDDDAEEFIVSWALEYPVSAPICLVVHLQQEPAMPKVQKLIQDVIHNYFAHKADLTERELRLLLREGRTCLLIGLFFLTSSVVTGELLSKLDTGTYVGIIKESMLIGGWVAMWRPIQIYLYEWWPILRKARIYTKMSQMPVSVKIDEEF